jgi:hypothetical protein
MSNHSNKQYWRFLPFSVLFLTLSQITFAQNVGDAIRYARIQNYGTARMSGVGGAFAALGADFGAVSLNPAGLAMFRTDEFMFTPGLYFSSTNAELNVDGASSFNDQASKLRFANIGMVFNTNNREKDKWRTVNVGLGYNQLSNFAQKTYYEGAANGSILNNWFDIASPFLAGGGNPDELYPLGEGLAYNAGAIYFQDGVPSYDFINTPTASSDRTHAVSTRGTNSEMTLSLAGNYMDKLMIGGSIGIPIVNYRQDATYTERDPNGGYEGNVAYFDNLTYTDFVKTNGIGFNAKLGATFRVSQAFRIGGAFHSPSFLNLTDNFSATFQYDYQDQTAQGNIVDNSNNDEATAEPFNYGLRTPWRGVFGGAVLLNNKGFISADIEYIDYAASRFNLTKNFNDAGTQKMERDLNADIQRTLQPTLNYKLGAEIVLDVFRLRAGYNLLGKPRVTDSGYNSAISLGAGLRKEAFYMDLAVRRSNASGSISPYAGSDTPKGLTDSKITDVLLTVGFKF